MSKHKYEVLGASIALPLLLGVACQSVSDGKNGGRKEVAGGAASATGGDATGLHVDPLTGVGGSSAGGVAGEGGVGQGVVCEVASSEAEIAPIELVFAFDVSGSMGHMDRPNWWHDSVVKWKPVVEATQAFFESSSSEGIWASMSFFPAAKDICDSQSYTDPEVPLVGLPSDEFGAAFRAYEAEVGDPLAGGAWRGGTPTLAALEGAAAYLDQVRATIPRAAAAVVLVTDGLPEGCGATDLGPVLDAASALNAAGTPTYVVGIENPRTPPAMLPPGWADWGTCSSGASDGSEPCVPPDTLADLHAIAEAGGTGKAFLIDTGSPQATQTALLEAISAIRNRSVSCELGIPQHPISSQPFDPDKIDVTVTSDGETAVLAYDPDCEADDAWHYNDEDAPERVVLCDQTCESIRELADAQLDVEFLCESRPELVK